MERCSLCGNVDLVKSYSMKEFNGRRTKVEEVYCPECDSIFTSDYLKKYIKR